MRNLSLLCRSSSRLQSSFSSCRKHVCRWLAKRITIWKTITTTNNHDISRTPPMASGQYWAMEMSNLAYNPTSFSSSNSIESTWHKMDLACKGVVSDTTPHAHKQAGYRQWISRMSVQFRGVDKPWWLYIRRRKCVKKWNEKVPNTCFCLSKNCSNCMYYCRLLSHLSLTAWCSSH